MKLRNMFLMFVVFLMGGLASSIAGLWDPYVTVKIKNASPQSLSEIEMKFQNTEGEGVFNLYLGDSFKTGEEMKFHFYVGGKGPLRLKQNLMITIM